MKKILLITLLTLPFIVIAQTQTLQFTEHLVESNFNGSSYSWAGDLDNDDDVDIVATSLNDDQVVWFENDGNQNFTKHVITTGFDGAYTLEVDDFDEDGDFDIWAEAIYTYETALFENDGNQNFAKRSFLDLFGYEYAYPQDMDGDGTEDFVPYSDNEDYMFWYKHNNQGYNKDSIDVVKGVNNQFTGDLDGDQDIDWIVQDTLTLASYIIINDQSGINQKSEASITFEVDQDGGTYFGNSDDVDNDGDLDLIAFTLTLNKVYWYENDGTLNYTRHTIDSAVDYPFHITSADMNKDGKEKAEKPDDKKLTSTGKT